MISKQFYEQHGRILFGCKTNYNEAVIVGILIRFGLDGKEILRISNDQQC